MKIAVPSEGAHLAQHFGRCCQIAMFAVDPAEGVIIDQEDRTAPLHTRGAFPDWLRRHNTEVVIAAGIGPKARALLAEVGIRVVLGAASVEARRLVEDFLADRLVPGPNRCEHRPGHVCSHQPGGPTT